MKNLFTSFRSIATVIAVAGLLLPFAAPASAKPAPAKSAPKKTTPSGKPTVEEARKFLDDASAALFDLNVEAQRAQWVQETFITYDTEILSAKRNEALLNVGVDLAKKAARFDGVAESPRLHATGDDHSAAAADESHGRYLRSRARAAVAQSRARHQARP